MRSKSIVYIMSLAALSSVVTGVSQVRHSLNSSGSVEWLVKEHNSLADISTLSQDGPWIKATVPGTVFVDYVNAGIEKDPNFGDNIYKVDKTKYNRDFIYRTDFYLPKEYGSSYKRVWLNLDGINRSGEIFLNGAKLGTLRGMMARGRFDISQIVNRKGANRLSVVSSVPNQKRHPEEKFANMASPTYLSSAGWDWMPNVPGLNCGITDNVYLSFTQDVVLHDPWVRTKLHNSNKIADVEISAELENRSTKPLRVTVTGVITPGEIKFSENIILNPDTMQVILFNSRKISQLAIHNPKLWWPNGLGEQSLYSCSLSVTVAGKLSDCDAMKFGIKEYSYRTDENNVFNIYVNGRRTFLKGGNWGMSEYLLRCRGDEYFTKINLHKQMNFNIIRNWMGSTTDKEFYQACDQYGIMIWDDFWLNSKIGVPEFPADFNHNAIEKIKRFRNHPSIVVWCGENEGVPGKYESGESLDDNLSRYISIYDGSDRHYQSDSRRGNGLSGSGLWKNYKPSFYFADASNSIMGDKYSDGKGWGLRSEIGTAVFTTFESFKQFMPKENWWPRDEMWNKHFFGSLAKNGGPDIYEQSIANSYGAPTGIEDFCEKSQLLNIETNKAMYEAWSSKMWNDASGIMIWMSQSAYPSFVWQTYDYYNDLTGAYWGAKKGCEPVHILWDQHTNQIMIANATHADHSELMATAMIFNSRGEQITSLRRSIKMDAPANCATTCFSVMDNADNLSELTDVNFLRLSLKSRDGNTISTNDYWFGKNENDYKSLSSIPLAELTYYVSRREVKDGKYYLDMRITNKGTTPAFAIRSRLINKDNGERILPVIQSDNYVILMPKEVRTIFFEFEDGAIYNHTNVQVMAKQYGYAEIIVE